MLFSPEAESECCFLLRLREDVVFSWQEWSVEEFVTKEEGAAGMMMMMMSSFGDAGLVGRRRNVESNRCAALGGETEWLPCDGGRELNVNEYHDRVIRNV